MDYIKTLWVDGQTPAIDAENLNNIETGVAAANQTADTNTTNIATNTVAIDALDTRVTANEAELEANATFHESVGKYATLIGPATSPDAYSLTTTYQDITAFNTAIANGPTVSAGNGTIEVAQTGVYRVSLFLSATTTENSQHVATAGLHDSITGIIMEGSASYVDDTGLTISFTGSFVLTAGRTYKIQIKGVTAGTIAVIASNFAVEMLGLTS